MRPAYRFFSVTLIAGFLFGGLPAAADEMFVYEGCFGSRGSEPGEFLHVEDFAWTMDGKLLVTDAGHAFIQVFDPADGTYLARFGGKSIGEGGLAKPEGIAVAPNGDVYVADYDTGFINRYDADFKLIDFFSEYGSKPGQNIRSEFMSIYDGKLYMADAGNHQVDVFDLSGKFLFDFGGQGTADGLLDNPEAAKVNSIGEVFVSDLGNDRVQVFDAQGRFLRSFGKSGSGEGEFLVPAGIAFDAKDNVYVGELGNDRVQVFTREGQFLASFGRKGSEPGEMGNVHGIIVEQETGRIFIADTKNNRVQIFRPSAFSDLKNVSAAN